MSHTLNMGFKFLSAARKSPNSVAISSEELEISFEKLGVLVIQFALHFQDNGVGRESTIAIETEDPVVVITSVLATSLLGSRWVYGGRKLEKNKAVEVTHYFQTELDSGDRNKSATMIDESWAVTPGGFSRPEKPFFPGFESENDTQLLLPSSGTTGTRKFMALSERNLFDRFKANMPEFLPSPSRCVFLFSTHSPPTLLRSMVALQAGWELVQSTAPEFWYKKDVKLVFGSPSQIQYVLKDARLPGKLGKALIGGAGMPDPLARELLEFFDVVVNTYGSTETNIVLENAKSLGLDGNISTETIWHDSDVQIVDEVGLEIPPGQEGNVRVKNAYLVPGYLNSPEAQSVAFREGWFYPGDRGLVTVNGNFKVCGRNVDLFNLGGIKVNAVLLDFTLQSVEGIQDAICFMMPNENEPDQLMAFVLFKSGVIQPDVLMQARVSIVSVAGAEAIPKRFFPTGAIPRTENGKPNRLACVQMAKTARELQFEGKK